jgi:hypothetical protein
MIPYLQSWPSFYGHGRLYWAVIWEGHGLDLGRKVLPLVTRHEVMIDGVRRLPHLPWVWRTVARAMGSAQYTLIRTRNEAEAGASNSRDAF